MILRPGGVPREDLEDALGLPLEVAGPAERPLAPGQLLKHYATRTPLRILRGPAGPAPAAPGRVGLLAFGPTAATAGYAVVEVLAPDGSPATAAANLFAALRRLDAVRARPHPRRALRRGGPRPRDHGPAATGVGPARRGRRRLAREAAAARGFDEPPQPGLDVGGERREADA